MTPPTWPDLSTTGRTARSFQDLIYSGGLNVREYGAKGDNATDDTAAIQTTIDAAAANAFGGGSQGTPVFFPVGIYLISKPINKRNVPLIGVLRSSYIVAKPTFSGGLHMICNWDLSDYGPGETDYTQAPIHTGMSRVEGPTYYHLIDGIRLNTNAVANLRGLGLVHVHETSHINHMMIGGPGTGAVGIDLQDNLDFTGSLDGNVKISNITMYGIGWTNELLVKAGGSGLIVDNWTTGPGYHDGSVMDVTLIDFTLNTFRSEALVDPALVANTDLAVIRLRTCKTAFINNPTYNVDAGRTAKHPYILADNVYGSGSGVMFTVRDLRMLMTGTHDPATPLIRDQTQTANSRDIMYNPFPESQIWLNYDPNEYSYDSITGSGGKQVFRVSGYPAITDITFISGSFHPDPVGEIVRITVTTANAMNILAPVTSTAGAKMTFDIFNNTANPMGAITWDSVTSIYKLAGAMTSPAAGKHRTISFYFDGTHWLETPSARVDI